MINIRKLNSFSHREYVKLKWHEILKTIVLAWKDFAKTELERQVCDFATNLAMDSSQGSAFLSTSGYQTSLKNSSSSFQFLAADEEVSVTSNYLQTTLNVFRARTS
jgi:hypothetical protein